VPHENDIALSNYGIERIFEATRAVGAVETNDTGVLNPPPGWHLMGTCRMGNTRRFHDITTQKTTPSNADAPDL